MLIVFNHKGIILHQEDVKDPCLIEYVDKHYGGWDIIPAVGRQNLPFTLHNCCVMFVEKGSGNWRHCIVDTNYFNIINVNEDVQMYFPDVLIWMRQFFRQMKLDLIL
jgi:hypothetical protein